MLSGKRHAAGIELDLTGRITPQWEVYGSYAFIPSASVDSSSGAQGTEAVGSRPGLTPRHSGTLWTTYRISQKWRVGAGLNARGADRPVGLAADSNLFAPHYVTDDARLARQHAVDGLIVSNHGGRTLDTALPTAWALPRLSDAVGDALPLLVDGGIRRGTDVLKAIALGARAVLVGRPIVQALAVAGAHGVAHALRLLRDELEIAMALSGVAQLAEVQREMLFDAPRSALGAPWERPR